MLDHHSFYSRLVEDKNAYFSIEELFEATRMFIEDESLEDAIELIEHTNEIVTKQYETNQKIYAAKLAKIKLQLSAFYELEAQNNRARQILYDAIRLANEAYRYERSEENEVLISLTLYFLGGHFLDLNQPEQAIKPYVVAANFLTKIGNDAETSNVLNDVIEQLCKIYTDNLNKNISIACYEYDDIIVDLCAVDQLAMTAREYEIEGNDLEECGKMASAKKCYMVSHAIRHILASKDETPKTIHEYSFAKIRLGNMAAKKGKTDEAKQWYKKSLFISNEFYNKTQDPLIGLDIFLAKGKIKALGEE